MLSSFRFPLHHVRDFLVPFLWWLLLSLLLLLLLPNLTKLPALNVSSGMTMSDRFGGMESSSPLRQDAVKLDVEASEGKVDQTAVVVQETESEFAV